VSALIFSGGRTAQKRNTADIRGTTIAKPATDGHGGFSIARVES
jgi:hypothetical protein